MSDPDQDRPVTAKEVLERARADRPLTTWLLLRSRQLAFALAMLIMLIFLLVFGSGAPHNRP